MPRVLFFRHFDVPSGGHRKLRDYFDHVRDMSGFEARIAFTKESVWDTSNPWNELRPEALEVGNWRAYRPDVLFLEGTDWAFLTEEEREQPPAPVLNLIQGLRHADPTNERFNYLKFPAARICVSPEVKEALENTGMVCGDIFTNPNGLDFQSLPAVTATKDWDIVVAGAKHPGRARWIGERLGALGEKRLGLFRAQSPGLRVKILDKSLPREEYLSLVARSRIAVLLPLEQEGFYLPALEAMALGTLVVCPDVGGNRSFCLDGENCLRPRFDNVEILRAAQRLLRMEEEKKTEMIGAGRQMAEQHSIEKERLGFQQILRQALPRV